jgi:hypothetical protein
MATGIEIARVNMVRIYASGKTGQEAANPLLQQFPSVSLVALERGFNIACEQAAMWARQGGAHGDAHRPRHCLFAGAAPKKWWVVVSRPALDQRVPR